MDPKVEEIEARRAARKAGHAAAREEQYAIDLEALDALEVEHGDDSVARLDVERYVKGHPTFVVLRAPRHDEYKRFCDLVARASDKGSTDARRDAQDMLAHSVWVYPKESDARKAMLKDFPGILLSIVLRAVKLVEAQATTEGKG